MNIIATISERHKRRHDACASRIETTDLRIFQSSARPKEEKKSELNEPDKSCFLSCFTDEYSAKESIPFFDRQRKRKTNKVEGRRFEKQATFASMLGEDVLRH